MTRFDKSIPPTYFDAMYAADPDPWRFAESDYERDKYQATIAALPQPRYAQALEIGCSIGVLTRELAGRCNSLRAIDVARAALDQAEARCADQAHVSFDMMRIPGDWPDGCFDLIVLSEILYYLDLTDLTTLAKRVISSTNTGANVILVHWLGETHYPLTGDGAAEWFVAELGEAYRIVDQARRPAYRLDVLTRRVAVGG